MFEEENTLFNPEYYGPMKDFITQDVMELDTSLINRDTWSDYYNGMMAIFDDGIEDDIIKNHKIKLKFKDSDLSCYLYITDFYYNIIYWRCIAFVDDYIKPCHVIFEFNNGFTGKTIQNFFNNHFILPYRTKKSKTELNQILADNMPYNQQINKYYGYLSVTLNLSDSARLARNNPEYNRLIHSKFAGSPIEKMNDLGMKAADRLIDIEQHESKQILGYDHCNKACFDADTSINKRQYKEGVVNIGPRPDGTGTVYPRSIDQSFITGGVYDLESFDIDSASARTAQILSHNNVSDSGYFARLLGLNNSDTFINKEVDHCNTRNYIRITLKTKRHFEMYIDRWYVEQPGMVAKLLTKEDTDMIGRTLYFYSPITCNLHSHHNGICHRCYGMLWLMNYSMNAGKHAAETISEVLTQILLSAKHLLQALIKPIAWIDDIFGEYFKLDFNSIVMKEEIDNLSNVSILIDKDTIGVISEDDYSEDESAINNLKEVIPYFILDINGDQHIIQDKDDRELYISQDLNKMIRLYATNDEDKYIKLSLEDIEEDSQLFYIKIFNNELSKTLDRLKELIDKKPITESYNKDDLAQEFIDTMIKGNINIQAVHAELLLSNQVRDVMEEFKDVNWNNPHVQYRMIALKDALMKNRSANISLMYESIAQQLMDPLTYKKRGASFIDLFFMKNPQKFLNSKFATSKYDSEIPMNVPFKINPDFVIHNKTKDDEVVETPRKLPFKFDPRKIKK